MSQSRHARDRSSAAPAPARAEGLRSVARVTDIRQHGWGSPVGSAELRHSLEQTRVKSGDLVVWNQWTTPKITLSRAAYLAILQGTPPQQLFDDHCYLDGPMGQTMGPFFYLRGDAKSLYSAIPEIRNVVLAQVIETASLPVPDLLGILLSRILTRS